MFHKCNLYHLTRCIHAWWLHFVSGVMNCNTFIIFRIIPFMMISLIRINTCWWSNIVYDTHTCWKCIATDRFASLKFLASILLTFCEKCIDSSFIDFKCSCHYNFIAWAVFFCCLNVFFWLFVKCALSVIELIHSKWIVLFFWLFLLWVVLFSHVEWVFFYFRRISLIWY